MGKRALVARQWTRCVLILVLLLGSSLVACTALPPAPETVPTGPEITAKAGETLPIRASAKGADRYEWTLQGAGQISSSEGPAILFTAPSEGGVALLSVTAHNDRGASPPTSLTINIAIKALCSPARAEGTVSPAVVISSITFVVKGTEKDAEQIVGDSGSIEASSGDVLEVKEVMICVEPFEGRGGQLCVEFDPVDTDGETMVSEVKSTRAVAVTPGFIAISKPDFAWTLGDNWRQLSVVTVHYPPGGKTKNPACEGGLCEVDDRMIVPIQRR